MEGQDLVCSAHNGMTHPTVECGPFGSALHISGKQQSLRSNHNSKDTAARRNSEI
jgi:hypothetical protein